MTASAIFAIAAGASDLGVGNELINILARARVAGTWEVARRAIANAFLALAVICLVLGSLLGLLGVLFEPASWLGSADSSSAANATFAVLLVGILIVLPLLLAERVLFGLQLPHHAGAMRLGAALMSFAGVMIAAISEASVPILLGAQMGGLVVGLAAGNVFLFGRTATHLRPAVRLMSRRELGLRLRAASGYAGLQLVALSALYGDVVVVASASGPDVAGSYALAQRMSLIPAMLVGVVSVPLWGMLADRNARGLTGATWRY